MPYLDAAGVLHIPFDGPLRYAWWHRKGQSLQATLAELGAPPEVVERYVARELPGALPFKQKVDL